MECCGLCNVRNDFMFLFRLGATSLLALHTLTHGFTHLLHTYHQCSRLHPTLMGPAACST